jgi:hypothetical protein
MENKTKEFTLTKEEFITRSMKGEAFIICANGERIYYDNSKVQDTPFRINELPLRATWALFDGRTLFTLEEPEPIIERRWVWLKNIAVGYTDTSDYLSDKYAEEWDYPKNDWYKKEDEYIDVVIKGK